MKFFTTLTVIATLLTLNSFGQTGPENLSISISGGSIQQRPVPVNIEFSATGNNAFDMQDITTVDSSTAFLVALPDTNGNLTGLDSSSQTAIFDSINNIYTYPDTTSLTTISSGAVSGHAVIPFTISSDGIIIDQFDSRPELANYMVYNFGIASDHADTIRINASTFIDTNSSNFSNNKEITFVYLKDLSTGTVYQLLNNTITLAVPANPNFAMNYALYVMVKSTISALPVTCFGNTNGGLQLHYPNCSNWNYSVSDNTNTLSSAVFNQDTTLNNLQAQSYTVEVYVNNLLADSQNVNISSPVQIVPDFIASAYSVSANDTVQFSNQSSGALNYTWDFGDSSTDTLLNATHSFSLAGNYPVTLTAVNANGCSVSFTDTVFVSISNLTVHQGPQFNHMNTFYTDQTEINISSNSERIAVNQNENVQQIQVQILNMNGQLISSTVTSNQTETFEVPVTGVYVVNVTSSNGKVLTEKVFVNKF